MLGAVLDFLANHVFVPFGTNEAFRNGFVWAVVLGVGVQAVAKIVQKFWKAVQLVFKPTKEPATKEGKSPWNILMGCAGQAVAWSVGLAMIILLLLRLG